MVPRCLVSTDREGRAVVLVAKLSEKDFFIKKGDTVTMEILFNEIVSGNNEYTREIKEESVLAEEIESGLATDQVEEVLTLLNEYKDLVAWNLQVGCT